MTELSEPIAIIGMSARLPGAQDTEQFWRNLAHGRETVSFLSEQELRAVGVHADDLASPEYVRAAPLLPDVEGFDADLFGMTRREAELCDPQLRVFLELTHAVLENAGYDPYQVDGACGVFGTTGPIAYYHRHLAGRRDATADGAGLSLMASNNLDYAATLASYKLNLTGPSFTVLSACSSSLVALHLACQSLRLGECDVAVAGGAMVMFPYGHGYRWQPGSVLSRDGHCRALDAEATGTIFGSGAAAVAVKRLSDALVAGDNIRAVIPGIAINNDGGPKSSFSAPSVTGQTAVIMEAMALAERTPSDISFVELHATGTLLGDPVEVAALARAYRLLSAEPLEPSSCVVGSVKSNLGHLGAVAGLASLIKVVLALEHQVLPPSINVQTPNPKLDLAQTPFTIDPAGRPWPRVPGRPRHAGVSSLGIGGTNAHLVVAEAPAPRPVRPDGRPRVIVWSARSRAAEQAQRLALGRFFTGLDEERFADAAATLQQGRTPHPFRAAVVAADAAESARLLSAPAADGAGWSVGEASQPARVAFAFPAAQDWQPGSAAALYGVLPTFTIEVDELAEEFAAAGLPVLADWHDSIPADPRPVNLLVQLALARTWQAWGVTPAAVIGVADGGLAAAVVTGGMSVAEAIASLAHDPVAEVDTIADGPEPDLVLVLGSAGSWRGRFGERALPALGASGSDPYRALLAAAGRLWSGGHEIDWRAVDPDRPVRRVALPGYPYQREPAWMEPLPATETRPGRAPEALAGCATAAEEPATSPFHTLVWTASPRTTGSGVAAGGDRTALVILPAGGETSASVLEAVVAAGFVPIRFQWPDGVDPPATDGLDALLRGVGAPDLLVHAASATPPRTGADPLDEELRASFWSLFQVVQHAARKWGSRLPEIVVVTECSADVSGSEPLVRARSTMHGLVATLRREFPGRSHRLIDVGPRTPAGELAAELATADEHDLVALRGVRRWVRQERPIGLSPGASPLRPGGRYLITGGLGGLGLAVARGLAETGSRPRLVLLQRRAADESQTSAVRSLSQLGAQVEIVAADVADAAGLRGLIGDLVAGGGQFHGIFHLAGEPGGALVQFREPDDARAVLRPKVHGTIALEDAFAGQPELDFVVHFSSRSAVQGLIGSGDYAAANAFQDASGGCHGFRARRVHSINWPAWAGVGMAARSAVDVSALSRRRGVRTGSPTSSVPSATWTRRCSAANDWFLDEHRLDGQPLAPGTSLLNLMLQAAQESSLLTGPVTVEDLTFHAPLVSAECEVRVTFQAVAGGWEAELCFRDLARSPQAEWIRSSRARITPTPADGAARRTVDLAEVREVTPSVVSPTIRSRAGRLRLGPRWQVIEEVWLLSPQLRVARLRLPDAFVDDLAAYPAHPALLDMATGLLCHQRTELFLPFTYRRIVVHDRLPGEFFTTVRTRQETERVLAGDIELCDATGRLVMEIEGFTMLVVDRIDTAAPEGPLEPECAAVAHDVVPPPASAPAGLAPADGVRMLLDLLSSPAPAQVLVTAATSGPAEVAPAHLPATAAAEPPPDGSDVEARVRAIWANAFGVPEVDREADFFALGGDSLSLIEVLAQVRDEFGVDLESAVIFDSPTVREFTETIERERAR